MAYPQEVASTSLRSSGAELKAILEKTGRRLKALSGIDKLDLLNEITDQIKEKIESRGRMHLRFAELNDLLIHEGLSPQQTAREAIQQLLQLRSAQLERLGSYSRMGLDEKDQSFQLALMAIPHSEINSCFAADDALSAAYSAPDVKNQCDQSLRSSAQELKRILEKTGRRLQCINGMDKLDLLNYIAEQIKEKVETRGRMNLRFSELNDLLIGEGLAPQRCSKDAIRELLALRQRQLLRLGNYAGAGLEEQDKTFCQALVAIPLSEVNECFARDDAFRSEVLPQGASSPDAHLLPSVRLGVAADEESPSSVLSAEKYQSGISLRSSCNSLRAMLEKTGHGLQGFGCMDAAGLLDVLAEQIRDKVELGQTMALPLSDLQELLRKEELQAGNTAKLAVEQLVTLRDRVLGRSTQAGSNSLTSKIKNTPDDLVEACFVTDPQIIRDRIGTRVNVVGDTPHRFQPVQTSAQVGETFNLQTTAQTKPKEITPASTSHVSGYGTSCVDVETTRSRVAHQTLEMNSKTIASNQGENGRSCAVSQAEARAQQAEAKCRLLEASVSELQSHINKVEARASLAEERAKVAELRVALEKAEARAINAETRAKKLEAQLNAQGGDPNVDATVASPRAISSKSPPRPQFRKQSGTTMASSPTSSGGKSLERSGAGRSQPTLTQTSAKAKALRKGQDASHMEGRPIFK